MPVDLGSRAFARTGLVERVAPFGVIAALALVTGIPEVAAQDRTWLAVAAALTGLALLLALGLPWDRLPPWAEVAVPCLYIAAVAALRHAAGGSASGYAALYLVPILWLALYGTRTQLIVGLGAVSIAMIVPIGLVGEPGYPTSEWRRLIILVGVGATIGLIVQGLVREVRAGSARAEAASYAIGAQQAITEALITAASDAIVSFDRQGTIVAANHEAASLFQRPDLVGRNVFETLVPADEVERLRTGFGRLMAADVPADRETRFEAELLRAEGTRVPVEIAVARIDAPEGMLVHTFVRDVTTRRETEVAAAAHLADLDRLLAVAQALGRSGVDGPSAICVAARELAGADFALLYAPDEAGRRLIVTGSAGRTDPPLHLELDPDRSMVGRVLRSGSVTFIGDLDADPRIDKTVTRQVGAAAAFFQPIAVDDRPVGVLVAYWLAPVASLPERTVTLFGLFAAQAANVVERAELLRRLEALARTDALTGAANRRTLDEVLERALAEARRSERPLSIVMLDLDHFKRYNDSHGHQAGDELLQTAVAAWQAELRPTDTLARYGGEEFLAVLPATPPAAVVVVADRLRGALPTPVTASAGAATWDGLESSAELIARADAALYQAKAAGRARTVASVPSGPAV